MARSKKTTPLSEALAILRPVIKENNLRPDRRYTLEVTQCYVYRIRIIVRVPKLPTSTIYVDLDPQHPAEFESELELWSIADDNSLEDFVTNLKMKSFIEVEDDRLWIRYPIETLNRDNFFAAVDFIVGIYQIIEDLYQKIEQATQKAVDEAIRSLDVAEIDWPD